MGLRLQRLHGPVDSLEPGQYTTRVEAKAAVRCRKCGGIDLLDDDHVIAGDGRVTPAWRCPTATCGEVVWLELDSFGEVAA